jgi:hypothetical protein
MSQQYARKQPERDISKYYNLSVYYYYRIIVINMRSGTTVGATEEQQQQTMQQYSPGEEAIKAAPLLALRTVACAADRSWTPAAAKCADRRSQQPRDEGDPHRWVTMNYQLCFGVRFVL